MGSYWCVGFRFLPFVGGTEINSDEVSPRAVQYIRNTLFAMGAVRSKSKRSVVALGLELMHQRKRNLKHACAQWENELTR